MILQFTVVIETLWLATIYGHRFLAWSDRGQASLDAALDDDMDDMYKGRHS